MSNYEIIIKKYVDQFIDFLKSMSYLNKNKHFITKNGGFPIFLEGNRTYYEQNSLDEIMESAIWRILVNGIFKELFSADYCKSLDIKCEWKFFHPQFCTTYIEEIEQKFPIEFIITEKGKRLGYRYTSPYWTDEIRNKILQNNKLDEIVIIDFSSKELSSFLHPSILCRDNIQCLSLENFFSKYFSCYSYDFYLTNVKKAVSEAYKHIGLKTIPNLTKDFLPFFINGRIEKIRNSHLKTKKYNILGTIKPEQKRIVDDHSFFISNEDYKKMDENFYKNNRFLALCGESDFATSFITSEYLYETLIDNNCFDLTAIICGYLKSIEQLLFQLVLINLSNLNGNENWAIPLWIKCNGKKFSRQDSNSYRRRYSEDLASQFTIKNYKKHVKFKTSTQKFFDSTFSSLVNLLQDYKDGWDISDKARILISTFLFIYCDECRNDHLHKDNISDPKEIEKIQDNTWLLFYYLLGSLKLTGNTIVDNNSIGIPDRSFENMYSAIMTKHGCGDYYFLEFSNLNRELYALPMKQESPKYNEKGLMLNKNLRFVKVNRKKEDDWRQDDWKKIEQDFSSENVLFVTPNNMPQTITFVNKIDGSEDPIIW